MKVEMKVEIEYRRHWPTARNLPLRMPGGDHCYAIKMGWNTSPSFFVAEILALVSFRKEPPISAREIAYVRMSPSMP